MKRNRYFILIILLLIITMILISGCEYDVAEPQWKKPFPEKLTPIINEIIPAQATPGVNTITIRGENIEVQGVNVYFDSYQADVIESSSTEIVVRRPNYVSDTTTIKVMPDCTSSGVKYQPYKIDPVIQEYGNLTDDQKQVEMRTPVADEDENLYVVQIADPRTILKIDTSGNVTEAGIANRNVTDATYYDGKIYLLANHPVIDVLDLQTGTVEEWDRAPGRAYSGEFSNAGYFVCGGYRSDLIIISHPDSTPVRPGIYNFLNIQAIRVTDNYVYVAAAELSGNVTTTIYRHTFDASGNLGAQDTVLKLGDTEFASFDFLDFAVSETGLIYIITDNENPMLVYDPADQTIDYFYKDILPFPCTYFNWGSKNYSYMVLRDAASFMVYRVDIGSKRE